MTVLLILASFLATLVVLKINNKKNDSLGSAFLKTLIIHGLIIVVSTELLSLNRSLTFGGVAFLWGLSALVNGGLLILLIYQERNAFNLHQITQKIWTDFRKESLANKIAILGVLVVLSICLLTSLVAPPNNYDSMTYHMPRVMHWIQNQSVAHYPTHNLRQISFSPFAGYVVTHLQILSGGDRFANCVQWLSFLGNLIGISLIAKFLGGLKTQWMTALVCASIPMAIMQAATTQVDLVVSLWLVCCLYFVSRTDSYSISDVFWLSASLGLAILTKPTATIFGLPLGIMIWFRLMGGWAGVRNFRVLFRSTFVSGIICISALSLSATSYWRNYKTFGKIFIDMGTGNTTIGPIQTISNALKSLALNLPFSGFRQFIVDVHQNVLKLDINDPANTFHLYCNFHKVSNMTVLIPSEDYVGSPFHLVLLLLSIITLLYAVAFRKDNKLKGLLGLLIVNVTGCFLYCLLIKWQVWANRLLLPLFILSVPIIGYFIIRYCSVAFQRILSILLASAAIFYSLTPVHRPLISLPQSWIGSFRSESILREQREDIYFNAYGEWLRPRFAALVEMAIKSKCRSLGVDTGWNAMEYPIWVLMASKGAETFKIEHINVQNETQKLSSELSDLQLCGILTMSKKDGYLSYEHVK